MSDSSPSLRSATKPEYNNMALNATNFKNINLLALAILLCSVALLIFAFKDGLEYMVFKWESEEYSHGYMIPLVSLFLMLRKLPVLSDFQPKANWLGPILLVLSIVLLVLGELSSVFTVIQYGFLVGLVGLFISFIGVNGVLVTWAAFVYLVFMIPLPEFLYYNLSSELQLISSSIGVYVVRLFNISVFLEGNVIDLGSYQLQVVEACSGLRYLFPLMSFGFLLAYLYKAPFWQKAIIFISTVPITVLMNSFRIAVIGVTVNYWGIAAAEGFLHDFEGWVVFMACIGVLVLEMWVLSKITKMAGSISERINLDFNMPSVKSVAGLFSNNNKVANAVCSLLVIVVGAFSMQALGDRQTQVPERLTLNSLPLFKGGWIGSEGRLDEAVYNELNVSDYIIANYTHQDGGLPVNFYIAYYDSQEKGASIHSPRSCIPGGGWQISEFGEVSLDSLVNFSPIDGAAEPLQVNRAVIVKDEVKSIVYYWFQQRGRIITNEYLAKWYIFWDGLTRNRTDGALVRAVVQVPENMDVSEGDKQILAFLKEFNPLLSDYIPN